MFLFTLSLIFAGTPNLYKFSTSLFSFKAIRPFCIVFILIVLLLYKISVLIYFETEILGILYQCLYTLYTEWEASMRFRELVTGHYDCCAVCLHTYVITAMYKNIVPQMCVIRWQILKLHHLLVFHQHVFFFHSVLSVAISALTPFSCHPLYIQFIDLFFGLALLLRTHT